MELLTCALLCGSSHAAPSIAADLMDEGSVALGGQLRAAWVGGPGVVVSAQVGPFVAEAQAGPGVLVVRGGGGLRLPIDLLPVLPGRRHRLVVAPGIVAFRQAGFIVDIDGAEVLGRVELCWLGSHQLGARAHLGVGAGRYDRFVYTGPGTYCTGYTDVVTPVVVEFGVSFLITSPWWKDLERLSPPQPEAPDPP